MKKLIAFLLALTLMLAMTGCVSQEDYDALAAQKDAEYNALLEDLNALAQERDALFATVDRHSALISAVESENYEYAADIISEMQIARDMAQKGDIADYLVTVELTPENFGEYFEFVPHYGTNAFGEEEPWSLNFAIASKAYDAGLIVYSADFKIEIETTTSSTDFGSTNTSTDSTTFDCTETYFPSFGFGGMPGETKYNPEECSAAVVRVEGSVTFVKAEYVTDYVLGEADYSFSPTQEAEIALVNGEMLYRSIYYGYKY